MTDPVVHGPAWANWMLVGVCVVAIAVVGAFGQAFEDDPVPLSAVADSAAGPWSHPDAFQLRAAADAFAVPYRYAYAIAWRETRNNASPWIRGAHGEYGRFQILPSTARTRCPGIDVATADGNLLCFVKLAREDLLACRGDVRCAARVHNGSGPRARAYADSVAAIVSDLYERGTQ